MALQHLRSSTADKRPTPGAMSDGQLALNTNLVSPGLFFKDSNGDSVKIGPVHVGTTAPNVTPGAGGQAGNSKGEQWLDTSSSRYVFKIWDGTAWRSEDGEFVNTSGDTMTGALGIIAGTAADPGVFFSGDPNTGIYSPGADQVAVATNATERARIDSSGRLLVGTSSARNIGAGFQAAIGSQLFIEQTSAGLTPATFALNRNDTNGPRVTLGKSRGTALGSNTIVQSGDELGRFDFAGADGTDLETVAAEIKAVVDGTPGANDMPGRLVFSTTADGASSPTERMRINSAGNIITTGTFVDPAITGTILEDVFTITDGAAFEVDPANGSIQLITLGASRTPKATNFAAGESITLMVNDGTAYTLTWTDATWGGSGVIWRGGTAPTLATTGYSVIQFWKVASQVYGASVGDVA
jgi:hypothetical protein